jgi:hypothetical protein
MDEIISYKMCAVKVRNAKLRNYLKVRLTPWPIIIFGISNIWVILRRFVIYLKSLIS